MAYSNTEQVSELLKLKAKRNAIRGCLVKIEEHINVMLNDDVTNFDDLEDIREQLLDKSQQLFGLDKDIESLTDLPAMEEEVIESQEFRERALSSRSKIERWLRRRHDAGSIADYESRLETRSNAFSDIEQSNHNCKIRLPKISLEEFEGKIEKWQEFWGQYESSIHENHHLSKIDKFQYLRRSLKGPASACIQGLSLTESNYDLAIELLKDRFGKKDVIVRSHVNKLLSLAPVKSCSNFKDLRQLHDTCTTQIRSLKSAGIEVNSYGGILFAMILKLIPDEIVLQYNRSVAEKDEEELSWDCEKLLKFLKGEVEAREKTFLFRRADEAEGVRPKDIPSRKHEFPKRIPSTAALNATSKSSCIICSEPNHEVEECPLSVQERKAKLLVQGRCYNCLKRSHISKHCKDRLSRCSKCNRKHSQYICDANENKRAGGVKDPEDGVGAKQYSIAGQGSIHLQSAVAVLLKGKTESRIRCLFDSGSERSFIEQKVSRKLKLQVVGQERLTIYVFGSQDHKTVVRKRVRFQIRSLHDPQQIITLEALETPCISEAAVRGPSEAIKDFCLKVNIPMADVEGSENLKLSLLIGSDYYWSVVTGKIRRMPGCLVGMETKLGYVFSGSEASCKPEARQIKVMKALVRDENLDDVDILRKLFDLEGLGISSHEAPVSEDDDTMRKFEDCIRFIDGRYQVELPWNENAEELTCNYNNAKGRFESLVRRFKRNPSFYERYREIVEKHLREEIAERVTPAKNQDYSTRKYYIPHHAVIREDKQTTKMRIVFDASSKNAGSFSLNDCLDQGPNLTPDLLSLLLEFRVKRVAVTADIEAAFLQIAIAPHDRDALRFLWVNEASEEPEVLRMTRVLFGATSSPFLLNATIKHHIKKYEREHPTIFRILNSKLYVDDLVESLEDEDEALNVHREVKRILGEGGFNMRKWKTNIQSLQQKFDSDETLNDAESCKILGYRWNFEEDTLGVDDEKLTFLKNPKNVKFSKRGVIRTAGQVFDPIGFLSPYTIRAKMILQEIWRRGLEWDDTLPEDLKKLFEDWCSELEFLREISLPRHLFELLKRRELTDWQLHCFVDASKSAYGAVVYLRFRNSAGELKSTMLASKAKVAPVRELTLPRLELLAAFVGARLFRYLLSHLDLPEDTEFFFWSDSMITLHWIKGEKKKLKVFVKNRVNEIRALTKPEWWNHCAGVDNPADFLSRGETLMNLKSREEWWNGPPWLCTNNQRPRETMVEIQEEDSELEAHESVVFTVEARSQAVLESSRYSNLKKLLRTTAWVFRFISNLRNKGSRKEGELLADEVNEAELYWIRETQEGYFGAEMEALKAKRNLNKDSKIKDLNPFIDQDGIMRIGGRLQYANVSTAEAHPIILPSQAHFSDLVIQRGHERTAHSGVESTLTEVRERFWIIKGRQRIKSIIFKCAVCKRFRTKPFVQDMAPLPPNRCREAFPFENTGVDYAGPLYVKEESGSSKAYVLLFTCAVTRAVHLELTSDMSTEQFLLAFKRFLARRGLCKNIYSDNAKGFKKAKVEIDLLNQILKSPPTQQFFANNFISWHFIVERAAWWGGFWERLVRTTKNCLRKTLGKSSLNFRELETTVHEVEAILNSRPLTFVYNDAGEPDPLTPGHFLVGRRLLSLPSSPSRPGKDLLVRYKHQTAVSERLWKSWRTAYLLELRSALQSHQPSGAQAPSKNSVVIIHDEKLPRTLWKIGIVEETHPGRDGKVRSCTIRLPHGAVLRRPIQLLYPLELATETEGPDASDGPSGPEDVATS